jgi:hypothetical protein
MEDEDYMIIDEDQQGMFICNEYYMAEHITHHLNDISFTVSQMDEAFTYDNTFLNISEQLYIEGECNVVLSMPCLSESDVTAPLRLRSITIMTVQRIQGCNCQQPLKILFDTGSDSTMWNQRSLPPGVQPFKMDSHGT